MGQIQSHPIITAGGDYSYYSIKTNKQKKMLILQLKFHYGWTRSMMELVSVEHEIPTLTPES